MARILICVLPRSTVYCCPLISPHTFSSGLPPLSSVQVGPSQSRGVASSVRERCGAPSSAARAPPSARPHSARPQPATQRRAHLRGSRGPPPCAPTYPPLCPPAGPPTCPPSAEFRSAELRSAELRAIAARHWARRGGGSSRSGRRHSCSSHSCAWCIRARLIDEAREGHC